MLGLIVGPGHHHGLMIDALKQQRIPFRYAVYWPSLQVYEVSSKGEQHILYQSNLYNMASMLLWSFWKRLPMKTKRGFHRDWLFILYDFLISKYFQNCKILIGWSQVSLYTFKKVKANGGYCILEHPMVHVEEWNKVIEQEYKKFPRVSTFKSLRTSLMVRKMKKEYEYADKINVLSSYAKETFTSRGVENAKLIITPLGTSLQKKEAQQSKKDEFVFLYVGRVELLKGIQYLLEAFKKLRQSFDAQLWIVGAIQEECKELLASYEGLYDFMGEKSKTELAVLYAEADVVVFPSLLDAFGLVIIESLAAGTPVIATNASAAKDIFTSELAGSIIPTHNVDALADQMVLYYKKLQGKPKYEINFDYKQYSIESYQKRFLDILRL